MVVAFSVDGKILGAAPNGKAKEYAVQDLLRQNISGWHDDLDAFPGPFGRVDSYTSEVLSQHLEKLAANFEEGVKHCTLESATSHPNSAALACCFVSSLIEANGRVQSEEFWARFAPVLAKRSEALRPPGDATAIQAFCARLCRG